MVIFLSLFSVLTTPSLGEAALDSIRNFERLFFGISPLPATGQNGNRYGERILQGTMPDGEPCWVFVQTHKFLSDNESDLQLEIFDQQPPVHEDGSFDYSAEKNAVIPRIFADIQFFGSPIRLLRNPSTDRRHLRIFQSDEQSSSYTFATDGSNEPDDPEVPNNYSWHSTEIQTFFSGEALTKIVATDLNLSKTIQCIFLNHTSGLSTLQKSTQLF